MSKYYGFFLIFLLSSCHNKKKTPAIKETTQKTAVPEVIVPDKNVKFKKNYKGTGKFIPIDLADKNYTGVNSYCKDTVTVQGWKIEYLVKDDNTKYDDLYIRWSKGNQSATYCAASTLNMRSFFIPYFKGENKTHLFLTHGCSTTGEAVLVLPKNTREKVKDYSYIIDYSIQYGQIGYIPERSFSLDQLEITIADLKSKTEKSVAFKNTCDLSPEEGCIDKITFGNTVEITATLTNANDKTDEKRIVEKHSLIFNR